MCALYVYILENKMITNQPTLLIIQIEDKLWITKLFIHAASLVISTDLFEEM
jgi:hypothetical protein